MPMDPNTALASLEKDVKDFINRTNEETEKHGKLGAENKRALEGLESKLGDINAQLLELEQNGLGNPGGQQPAATLGQQFANSDALKAMAEGRTTRAALEIKNAVLTGDDATVAPDRSGEIVGGPLRKLRILDTIAKGTTTSNAVEYTQEKVWTPAAAERAEGGQMAESTITFELKNVPVANVAHFIKLSKQIINDAPRLASYVDNRMRHGTLQRLDHQLINGDGTGSNISGLALAGNHSAFTPEASSKAMDNIRRAIGDIETADYQATAVYLNPKDCEALDLDKGTDGHYTSSAPREFRPMRPVWGLPVVSSNAVPQGKFMVGDFGMATQFTERQGVIVDLSESDSDNFTKGLVTLRAECRGVLEIYRPGAIKYGSLVGA